MKNIAQFKPLLVFSMLLTLISPVLSGQNSYRGGQDTILVPSSGRQRLQGKIIQNCLFMHQCALRFNGANQWVNLEQFHGFDTAAFTLETWFNWAGAGTPILADKGGLTDGIPFISIGGSEGSGSDTDANLFFGIQASTGRLMAVFKEAPSASGSLGQDYQSLATPGSRRASGIMPLRHMMDRPGDSF